MKKKQLKTWRIAAKKVKLTARCKIVEPQEDRSLFARMLVVAKSISEINLRETVGKFSLVPRALFAADGIATILHCSSKSSLM